MTTEEKARAYDEALKKARFYHGNCPSEPERKKLEKMFPVLAESEDERIRKAILNGIQECQDAGSIFGTIITRAGITYLDVYAWLEKQKEQKPAEWSDEDEDNLNRVIRVLEDNDSDWKELSDWLKSLRPSWKPSKEQIKALEDAFRKDGSDEYRKTINSLYQDLKKL